MNQWVPKILAKLKVKEMRIKKDLETHSSCEEQQSLETPTNPQEHKLLQTKHIPIPRLPGYNNTKPHFSSKFLVNTYNTIKQQ